MLSIIHEKSSFLCTVALFFFSIPVLSQVSEEKIIISGKEIAERLTRLEEGQKALNKRIDDTNKRIDDLRAEMNKRFDDVNRGSGEDSMADGKGTSSKII